MEPEQPQRIEDPLIAYLAKLTKEITNLLNYDIRRTHLQIGERLDTVRDLVLWKHAEAPSFEVWLTRTLSWKPRRAGMLIQNHRMLERLEIQPTSPLGNRLRAVGWYKLTILLSLVPAAMGRDEAIALLTKTLDDGLSERAIQAIAPKRRPVTKDAGLAPRARQRWHKADEVLLEVLNAAKKRKSTRFAALVGQLGVVAQKLAGSAEDESEEPAAG